MTNLLFLLFLPFISSSELDLDCIHKNEECQIVSENNLLRTVMGVSTVESCLELCQRESGNYPNWQKCEAFTHYGNESYPFRDTCMLFSQCNKRRSCNGCTAGSSETECTCSINYSSVVSVNNFVGDISIVEDELACKRRCAANKWAMGCKVYTFYNKEDPIRPNVCILRNDSGLQNPLRACDHCVTGPARCQVGQRCQAAIITNGSFKQVILAEESTSLNLVAGEKDCFVDLKIVAIGGGGGFGGAGAAGSGFVETTSVRMNVNNPVAQITVGQVDKPSKVEIGGEVVIKAMPGQQADGHFGGGGYSGGGATGGLGGSDGSNGGNSSSRGGSNIYPGGDGSGFDLSLVSMKNFILTPGSGGKPLAQFGGGGGGVLVNGRMPGGQIPGGQINYVGNGFGGGSGATRNGFPGCVLVEIEN